QVDLADNDAPGSTIADDTADNMTGSSVPGNNGSTTPTIDDDPVPATDAPPTTIAGAGPPVFGLVTASGSVTIKVDGVDHWPMLPGDPAIHAVDGDNMDGLVIEASNGIWWVGVDETHLLADPIEYGAVVPRLLDVERTSLGMTVAAVRSLGTGGEEIVLYVLTSEAGPLPDVRIPVAADSVPGSVASGSLASTSDLILINGTLLDGCHGLNVLDFAGEPQRLPIFGLPIPPNASCVNEQFSSIRGAFAQDGTVVLAGQGQEDDWSLVVSDLSDPENSRTETLAGAFLPESIEVDEIVEGTATAIVANAFGEAVAFSPRAWLEAGEFAIGTPGLNFMAGLNDPENPTSVRYAPGFNSQLAEPYEPMPEEPIDETPGLANLGPPCSLSASLDEGASDFNRDRLAEIVRETTEGDPFDGGLIRRTVHHGVQTESGSCEEVGALTDAGDQLAFILRFTEIDPAGMYCEGGDPLVVVQWFGSFDETGRAIVETQAYRPPTDGTIWQVLGTGTITGLERPIPPDSGVNCPFFE
ncbi:MAG: hypothetical protein ACR2P0_01465, partial [Acidimicrobiales bacterium]